MSTRGSQLYLAHSFPPLQSESEASGSAAAVRPEDAAEYIAEILCSLRTIAAGAQLPVLSDLLSVAEEEARLHSRI